MTITGLPPASLVTGAGGIFVSTGSSLTYSQTANDVTITPALGTSVTIPAATDSLAGMLDAVRAATIDGLAPIASSGDFGDLSNQPDRTAFLSFLIDGGGAAIVAPITRYFYLPFAGTITGWVLMADQAGSITVDIWKKPFGSFPPTVSNSITGGSPMSLSAAQSGSSIPPPSSWTTTALAAGDCLAFNVSAAATIQVATIQLILTH